MFIHVRTDPLTVLFCNAVNKTQQAILSELIIERLYSAGGRAKKWCVFGKAFLFYPPTDFFQIFTVWTLIHPHYMRFSAILKFGHRLEAGAENSSWRLKFVSVVRHIFGDSRPSRVYTCQRSWSYSSQFATNHHSAKNLQDMISGSWEKNPALKEKQSTGLFASTPAEKHKMIDATHAIA